MFFVAIKLLIQGCMSWACDNWKVRCMKPDHSHERTSVICCGFDEWDSSIHNDASICATQVLGDLTAILIPVMGSISLHIRGVIQWFPPKSTVAASRVFFWCPHWVPCRDFGLCRKADFKPIFLWRRVVLFTAWSSSIGFG